MQLPVSTYDNDDPSSTARLINCYAEAQPQGARSPVVLRKCPGMIRYEGAGSVAWKGSVQALVPIPGQNDHLFMMQVGPSNGAYTLMREHTLGSSFDAAAFKGEYLDWAADADSVILINEPEAWRLTWSGGDSFTLTQINDADFTSRGAGGVEFLDNYFLFREPGTRRFFGSDVGAPTAYTSTSFATKEAGGDLLVGIKATRANLLLFGAETIEIWDAVGGGAFPFRRIINGAIDKGCINGRTIAEIDDQVLWLADDNTVRMMSGMEASRISNFAIERYLQNSESINSGRGYAYSYGGHNYYVLKFPDRCFVYDLTLGLWHERRTIGSETWAWGTPARRWGKVWFGRQENPSVYDSLSAFPLAHLSDDVYYEHTVPGSSFFDVPMVMEWTYQPVWGSGQRVFHDRLEIVIQTGVGNSDATAPVVMLEASDDGGQTWFSFPNRSLGAQGKTFQRVVWNGLGSSYQRVYKASVSDPVPVRVMSTELTARGGRV